MARIRLPSGFEKYVGKEVGCYADQSTESARVTLEMNPLHSDTNKKPRADITSGAEHFHQSSNEKD